MHHCVNLPTAATVSILPGTYNVTEGTDMSIEVCVEIVMGTVNEVGTVEVQTIAGSATGKLILWSIIIVITMSFNELVLATYSHRPAYYSLVPDQFK